MFRSHRQLTLSLKLRLLKSEDMKSTISLLLKTLLPVAIGIGVVAWLMGSEFSLRQFKEIPWTGRSAIAIAVACLFVVGREWGMMWRWRVLTDRTLSWWQTFKVTLMCEFTSAVTPTTAGGSALSMIFLKREGVSLGRGASLTMVLLMLDELFVVIACPLILILVPDSVLFSFGLHDVSEGARIAFWIVYAGVCLVTLFLFLGALVVPHRIARMLVWLFSFKLLRRWHGKAEEFGANMVAAGADLRTRSARWWIEAMGATVMTWVSRYLVVNALFWGFAPEASQIVVFARQFVVWTLLTVSPTPGGSGISEWLFTNFYGDLFANMSVALVIAIVWRLITYYVYLAAGVVMLPLWLRSGRKQKK